MSINCLVSRRKSDISEAFFENNNQKQKTKNLMMASPKPAVMVMGSIGTGKSNMMQILSGSNDELFKSSR